MKGHDMQHGQKCFKTRSKKVETLLIDQRTASDVLLTSYLWFHLTVGERHHDHVLVPSLVLVHRGVNFLP